MSQSPLPESQLEPRLPQPPLSISHLMLWTLGSAIILTCYRAFDEDRLTAGQRILEQFRQAAVSIVDGVQLAAVIVFAGRFILRKGPLPREPGHWLLLKGGVSSLVGWGIVGLLYGTINVEESHNGLTVLAIITVVYYSSIAMLSLLAILALNRGKSRLWQAYFGYCILAAGTGAMLGVFLLAEHINGNEGIGLGWGTEMFLTWSRWQIWMESLPLLVGLCGLLILDWRTGKRRDWLHYAGVVVEIGGLTIILADHFARIYLLRSAGSSW